MKIRTLLRIPAALLLISWIAAAAAYAQSQSPLSSWRDTDNKHAIIEFVQAVSKEGSPDFIPEEYRIATFDMDGTILVEKPLPFNAAFVQEYLAKIQEGSPSLQNIQPYKAIRENDASYMTNNYLIIFTLAFMGYSEQDYLQSVVDFARTSIHPRFNKPYGDLFYRPMIELIAYLQSNGFRVYVVSGSNQGFIRGIAKQKTGIPNSNLIGSQTVLTYHSNKEKSAFTRTGAYREPASVATGKPLMIEYQIGETPILAFGNSDGDQQMFEYTATNSRRNLVLCLEHDDADREYVYDSRVIYKPEWRKVSIKDDFVVLFPGE